MPSVFMDMSVAYSLSSVPFTDRPKMTTSAGVQRTRRDVISSMKMPGLGFTTATCEMRCPCSSSYRMNSDLVCRVSYKNTQLSFHKRYSPFDSIVPQEQLVVNRYPSAFNLGQNTHCDLTLDHIHMLKQSLGYSYRLSQVKWCPSMVW